MRGLHIVTNFQQLFVWNGSVQTCLTDAVKGKNTDLTIWFSDFSKQLFQLSTDITYLWHLKTFFFQLLLDLARVIFEEQSNVAKLIHKIMMHTQALLQCERCQVLLVHEASKVKSLYHISYLTLKQPTVIYFKSLINKNYNQKKIHWRNFSSEVSQTKNIHTCMNFFCSLLHI